MRWLIDARPLVDPLQGGVSRVARGLVEGMVKKNEEQKNGDIVLATTGREAPVAASLPRGKNTSSFHISIPNKIWSLGCMCRFWSLDRKLKKQIKNIDAVFLPNLGFIGTLTAPYCLLLHDVSFLIEPRWFKFKARWWHTAVKARELIHNASFLFAVSEQTRQDTIRLLGISEEKITVLPIPSVPPSSLLPSPLSPPTPYILALGGNDPRKNSRLAIHVVNELRKNPRFSTFEIKIVGGPEHPRPTDEELASLYKNATAFLYPSWYEGYGLPLHEATNFGVPCIASTAGALPETAPPGTLFADPAKPHHWIEALEEALTLSLNTLPSTPPSSGPSSWQPAAQMIIDKLKSLSKNH